FSSRIRPRRTSPLVRRTASSSPELDAAGRDDAVQAESIRSVKTKHERGVDMVFSLLRPGRGLGCIKPEHPDQASLSTQGVRERAVFSTGKMAGFGISIGGRGTRP